MTTPLSKSYFPLLITAFASGTALGLFVAKRMMKLSPEQHLWSIVMHSFTGALIHAGDSLELYDHLEAMKRPVTAQELAEATGWSERWLEEFLAQAAGAGVCAFRDGKFSMTPGYAPLLCNPATNPRSLAGLFEMLLPLLKRAESVVVQAIQSGKGVDYDFGNAQIIRGIDRKNYNWFRDYLIKDVLEDVVVPATGESLVEMLKRGVHVADIGCGCGASSIIMAKAFPKSIIYAYEASALSLQVLQERIQAENIPNIVVCNVAERGVGDGPDGDDADFSFVFSHDLLHDMTDPQSLIRDVKTKLSDRGCWIVVDIKCQNTLTANIQSPASALFYGFSCLLCLACSTSEDHGAGLGTCGLPASKCQDFMKEAGFTHFEERGVASNPVQARYIVA
ncbi:hypothetical protein FisN_17Hh157 [Fistulifera solaris]|uniref:Methyltransferase domain-containing protein n=1 Tax=Fistulifera solaris TaxID=1519565 RepID=A0A1Z5JGV3_FISSO|nr:hypothetical protein FisN_17Hh157 [Fistulifera solaris]|eukprot:GAX13224.1 hypothetical protein FisN_17Hh157 [Fistulifera solaris]